MIFDRIYLIQALILLLFPLGLFFGKWVSLRQYSSSAVADEFSLARSWATIPALWIDPLRAYLGTMLLNNENFAVRLVAGAKSEVVREKLFFTVGVLALALIVQMFAVRNPEDDDTVLAPVGFTIGMIFALISMPTVAVLSTVVAVASVAAFRSWHAFFLGAIVAVGGTGLLLMRAEKIILGAVMLLLVEPVVVCVVVRREFVIPVRRRPD